MATVLVDAVAAQLHLALGLDAHTGPAVAGDAVVGNACELAALQHGHPAIVVGVNGIGDEAERFTASDVQPSSCQPSRGAIG